MAIAMIAPAGPQTVSRKSNIDLQPNSRTDDQYRAMRHARHDVTALSAARGSSTKNSLSLGDLAHELNSLLDGSMRCVAQAQRAIGESDSSLSEDVAARLRSAEEGMKRMAALLERAIRSPRPDMDLFDEHQTL